MADQDTDTGKAATGVQNLIDRIRDDGVKAGKEESARIIREAEHKAAAIIADAKAQARESLEEARSRIASERHSAEESLKLAARDTIKELGVDVRAAFERQLKRFVSAQLEDKEFLREVILALAGRTAAEAINDRAVQILLSENLVGDETDGTSGEAEAEERIRQFILSVSSESLREGVEFKLDSSVESGVSVRIVGEQLRIDLNDVTISDFLVRHLLPRYRRILTGEDSGT